MDNKIYSPAQLRFSRKKLISFFISFLISLIWLFPVFISVSHNLEAWHWVIVAPLLTMYLLWARMDGETRLQKLLGLLLALAVWILIINMNSSAFPFDWMH